MGAPSRAVRAAIHVWLAIVLALALALYRLVVLRSSGFAAPDPAPGGLAGDWISGFLFLWLLALMILAHRGWRRVVVQKDDLQRVIASINPDVLIVIAPDRTIRMCNPSVGAMFGYESSEVVGQKTDILYSDRRVQPGKREVFEQLQRMGFHVGGATGRRKDGSTFPLELITGQLREHTGAVILIRDMTEHRRAEDALRESERMYRILAENVTDVIWTADLDLRLTYVSPSIQPLAGAGPEDVMRAGLRGLLSPEGLTKALAALREESELDDRGQLPAGHSRTLELDLRTRDGRSVCTETRSQFLRDPNGRRCGVVGVTRDITERKRLEEKFLQAQKLETVGRLAGGVAHDFNNLLTVITGYTGILADQASQWPESQRSAIEEVRKAATRASSLTHQLLAFSRRQTLQPRTLNLNHVVSDMEKMVRRLIGEDVELITRLDPELACVSADQNQIEQVLMNLAVNARDAMPGGGKLIIETRNFTWDGSRGPSRPDMAPGQYALLSVSDTGMGMPPDTQSHLFEPFFTTKETGKGTGLGLSTVYGIIRQSDGHITVYSEVGQGSTFKIYLPRCGGSEAADEAPSGAAQSTGASETLLLVEDEADVRRLLRAMLLSSGYRIIEARNGADALAAAEAHAGPISLVVTDVIMPGMNGREVYERLLARRPGVLVLYISAYTDETVFQRGVLAPDTPFLSKPFTRDVLLAKIREILAGHPVAAQPPPG